MSHDQCDFHPNNLRIQLILLESVREISSRACIIVRVVLNIIVSLPKFTLPVGVAISFIVSSPAALSGEGQFQ